MDTQQIQNLVDAVVSSLFVELEASGRHVHVTKEQAIYSRTECGIQVSVSAK